MSKSDFEMTQDEAKDLVDRSIEKLIQTEFAINLAKYDKSDRDLDETPKRLTEVGAMIQDLKKTTQMMIGLQEGRDEDEEFARYK